MTEEDAINTAIDQQTADADVYATLDRDGILTGRTCG